MLMGDILVLSYVLLAWGLNLHNGMYTPQAFTLVTMAYILLVCVLLIPGRRRTGTLAPSVTGLYFGATVLLVLQYTSDPLLYPVYPWFKNAVHVADMATLCILFLSNQKIFPRLRTTLLFLAMGMAVVLRLLMPVASPAPRIDVHSFSEQAVAHMLRGENPYAAQMKDVYGGTFPTVEHYAYPPATLYPQAGAAALGLDVRYSLIVAEFLFLGALWMLLKTYRWPASKAALLLLLFLYHPRGLFIVEQAWNEPLLLASFGLFLLLTHRSQKLLAAAVFGCFLATKQSVLLLLLPFAIIERNPRRWAMVVLAGLLTLLPLALWDWRLLWENGMQFDQNAWFRTDSLSLSSFLFPFLGPVSSHTTIAAGGAAAVLLTWRFWGEDVAGFLRACVLTLFSIFVLGTHSFCNFYYLAGGLLLLLIATPTETTSVKPASGRR